MRIRPLALPWLSALLAALGGGLVLLGIPQNAEYRFEPVTHVQASGSAVPLPAEVLCSGDLLAPRFRISGTFDWRPGPARSIVGSGTLPGTMQFEVGAAGETAFRLAEPPGVQPYLLNATAKTGINSFEITRTDDNFHIALNGPPVLSWFPGSKAACADPALLPGSTTATPQPIDVSAEVSRAVNINESPLWQKAAGWLGAVLLAVAAFLVAILFGARRSGRDDD